MSNRVIDLLYKSHGQWKEVESKTNRILLVY